jgi:3-deoxy-manno-octulosonate cytidylyltransferase (CMP-KDO synthetase)
MNVLGIIPARYGSTRLPGKPLIKVKGKTIIQRVYERASMAEVLYKVVVATDDVRIYNHVRKFGGVAVMTRQVHRSGTMRCGEVIANEPEADIIINIQGDEPLINPGEISRLGRFLIDDPLRQIATLVKRIDRQEDITDPGMAKVVMDLYHRVLYFSRSPIPFVRDYPIDQWQDHADYYKHIGLYGYTRKTLLNLSKLDPSDIEESEMLEQLNWLYHGYAVHALETDVESIGIDTQEDVHLLEHILSLANT